MYFGLIRVPIFGDYKFAGIQLKVEIDRLGFQDFSNDVRLDAFSACTWFLAYPFQVGIIVGVVFLIGGIVARLNGSSKMRNGLLSLTYLALLALSYPLMTASA